MSRAAQESKSLKLKLRYLGDRFDKRALSCDDTQDIAVFGTMLAKIATRVLKNAAQGGPGDLNLKDFLYFEFGGISQGSSVAEINISADPDRPVPAEDSQGQPPSPISCVEDAYRILMGIMHGDRDEESFECFRLIERDIEKFGKSLKTGDELRFPDSKRYLGQDVFYNRRTLREMRSTYNGAVSDRVVGTGRITGFRTNGSVYIRSVEHGDFTFRADPNKVRSSFDGFVGSEVEFVLDAALNGQRKITRIKSCHYLELAPVDKDRDGRIESMLKELSAYSGFEKGWLEGEGEKISDGAIRDAKKFIEMTPELAHRYRMSPTPEGFVSIEYEHEGWGKCLDFLGQGVEVLTYDLGKKFESVEGFFEKINQPTVDRISNRGLVDLG